MVNGPDDLLGGIPDEVRIIPLADDASGYVTGFCDGPVVKRSVAAVSHVCGVADGHGVGDGEGEGDLYELSQLVPDEGERERIMVIARQVMEHREFKAVRDAIRTRLQFRDVLHRDEIERIATKASQASGATPPTGRRAPSSQPPRAPCS